MLYTGKKGQIQIKEGHRQYLDRWPHLLRFSGSGTPIIILILWVPTMVVFTDTLKYAMGWYGSEAGVGWQYKVPSTILEHTTINHLQFLAMLIQRILVPSERDGSDTHILAWRVKSSAVSWVQKAPWSDKFAAFLFKTYCSIIIEGKSTLWGRILQRRKFLSPTYYRGVAYFSCDYVLQCGSWWMRSKDSLYLVRFIELCRKMDVIPVSDACGLVLQMPV